MKISAVNVYFVRPRWGFVEIVTDGGLVGWGEAVLEGHAKAVLACVEEYRDYLVGKDPSRIEDIWSTIYRAGFYRGGGVMMSALSGIDQALWDIKGKAFNAPCYELMGGRCRDRMKVYSWIGGDRPGDTGRAAKEVHKPMAKVLAKKLEPFNPMFIEEPVLCEHMEDFKEIAAACDDFKRLLNAGGVDIIQPDLSHAGGLTEVKKIGAMAEAYDVALAPHCPLGPIALAACLQVDATCYNAVIQEQSIGIHYNVGKTVLDYVTNKDDFAFTDGWVELPKLPGLGVKVNKELVIEENKTPHNWKNPVWRHADGSVAEW